MTVSDFLTNEALAFRLRAIAGKVTWCRPAERRDYLTEAASRLEAVKTVDETAVWVLEYTNDTRVRTESAVSAYADEETAFERVHELIKNKSGWEVYHYFAQHKWIRHDEALILSKFTIQRSQP